MKSRASQNHPGRFAIYFLLMFAGLAWAVLGVGYQEPLLIGIGAVFILATVFAFRSMVPLSVSAWALVGMLLGGLVGASFGLYVGYVAEAMVGIIGAAVLGATAGVVLLGGGLAGALGAPVFPGVKVVLLPRVVAQGLFFIGAMIGGILGVIGLREVVTTVFGPIGGGAVALGSLGLVVGLFLGNRRIEYTDIQEEAREYTREETSEQAYRLGEVDFRPRMPEVDEMIEEALELARQMAADREKRQLVILTPGRNVTSSATLPPRETLRPEFLAELESLAPSDRQRSIVAIGMTDFRAFQANPYLAVPFLKLLHGLVQIGHGVILFEGHPSALAEVCRDADLLIVDGEMIPFLQPDWLPVAQAVMREPNVVKVRRKGTTIFGLEKAN